MSQERFRSMEDNMGEGTAGSRARNDRFHTLLQQFNIDLVRGEGGCVRRRSEIAVLTPDELTSILPIYGFLGTPAYLHNTKWYGNMIVHLRKSNVLGRTTYPTGDSLGLPICCRCVEPDSRLHSRVHKTQALFESANGYVEL